MKKNYKLTVNSIKADELDVVIYELEDYANINKIDYATCTIACDDKKLSKSKIVGICQDFFGTYYQLTEIH